MEVQNQQKYCTGCGAELCASDQFCQRCGKAVSKSVACQPHPMCYSGAKQAMPYRTRSKTNVYCIAGIVLSGYAMFGYIIAPVFSIAGIIVSSIGMNRVAHSGEEGKNLALAGILIGALGLLVYALIVFVFEGSGIFRNWIPFSTVRV